MTITVEIKTVYGNQLIYPVDDTARNFARLCGTTTLTTDAIRIIKQMGYQITIKQEEVQL